MEIGRSYAYREKRGPDVPMLKVKLLDKVGRKGKIKVRFEDGPHPGLEEYIETRQVVCAWGQRQAVIRDEQRATRLAEFTAKMYDKALCEAASAVLESSGESGAYVGAAVTAMDEDELQRILYRAGLETPPTDLHFLGYRDRHGQVHFPLDSMVMVAKAFAAAEPQTVVEYLDDREEELRIKGRQPEERWTTTTYASSRRATHSPGSGPGSSRRPRCSGRRSPVYAVSSQERPTTSETPARIASRGCFCERWTATDAFPSGGAEARLRQPPAVARPG
jgi:hypothetical protein